MSSPILHHYPVSPFSEKVRAMLGYKGMHYRTVRVPAVMPKPNVTALTGGYRKTPVLQLGCDIYCDTRLIARVLEELEPTPSLFPQAFAAGASWMAQWADLTLFHSVIPFALEPASMKRIAVSPGAPSPEEMRLFAADRAAFAQSRSFRLPSRRVAFSHLPVYLAELDAQLGCTGDYLFGHAPCIADFSVYHSLWYLNLGLPEKLAPYAGIRAWMARIAGFGHGFPSEVDAEVSLEECRNAAPRARGDSLSSDVNGVGLGQRVQVTSTDLGPEVVEGLLVHLSTDAFAVECHSDLSDRSVVHFPRIGFELRPAAPH